MYEKKAAGEEAPDYKTYETVDQKIADPEYGVAKGKVPAREVTVARRINTDSKEVTTGIDQVLTLTKGGMKDMTGSTFSDVKGAGFLSAPGKAFTNKISDTESQMYDAMMYPLVKGIALYTNPDYRPTESDVKNAAKAYKADSGQKHEIQLEKLAELKKNYLAASESYLDSHIMNPAQANNIKQQIRYVEKAIPWDVNDVTKYVQSGAKDKMSFGKYLSSKGTPTEGKKETARIALPPGTKMSPGIHQDAKGAKIKVYEDGTYEEIK